jgi:hypothetical protein
MFHNNQIVFVQLLGSLVNWHMFICVFSVKQSLEFSSVFAMSVSWHTALFVCQKLSGKCLKQ